MDEGQETLDRSMKDAESIQHQVRGDDQNAINDGLNGRNH